MKKLSLDLENCFGIQKLDYIIDYSENNIAIIYAPNGTMKSSLAKTFESIRDNKPVEEKVFGYKSIYSITDENGTDINPESIIVINPFERRSYDNQGMLMADPKLRSKYQSIHKSIEDKKVFLYSQVKEALKYSSRSNFDVTSSLLDDWQYEKTNEYKCLTEILSLIHEPTMTCTLSSEELDYNSLFNDKVCAILTSGNTATLIEEYENKYNELVDNSPYMQKGIIDHNNYGNISESLNDNGFFKASNEVVLNGKNGGVQKVIKSQADLDSLINDEKERILNTKSIKDIFENINKSLNKNKDTIAFGRFIQKHQDIIQEYNDIKLFKKKVWVKAFADNEALLQELLNEYKTAQNELNMIRTQAKKENTDWEAALSLFLKRFYVPFKIEPSNQDDVILNLEMPSFKYSFLDNRGEREISKEDLLGILSTGEERAYYILNMIFQILVSQKEGKEKFILLDDISESFDYKNKYAIIEYVNDISEYVLSNNTKTFTILLLTHNFDFYRTIASRLTKKKNSYIAYLDNGTVNLEVGQYTRNVFSYFKQQLLADYHDSMMIASIPFVRNLIEYTDGIGSPDYLLLTCVLHYKETTRSITVKTIQDVFNKYWFKDDELHFADGRESELIYDLIISEANKIQNIEKLEIGNKLILSMSIRLFAEKYMIDRISNSLPDGKDIIKEIYTHSNQSARLIKKYKEAFHDETIKTLELVSMITPENIHLNSFMFEPILDMSIRQLFELYEEVKNLASL